MRVPVVGGHSEAINIEMERDFEVVVVRSVLGNTPGVTLRDRSATTAYPMPLYAREKDAVL